MSNILRVPFTVRPIISSEKGQNIQTTMDVFSIKTLTIESDDAFNDEIIINDPCPQTPTIELYDPFRLI